MLVDAAYDTSLRDLRTHWRPITGLVVELRNDGSIGDAAFRIVLQELDWAELSAGGGRHE